MVERVKYLLLYAYDCAFLYQIAVFISVSHLSLPSIVIPASSLGVLPLRDSCGSVSYCGGRLVV